MNALEQENVAPDAICQDCKRSVEEAYGKIERDDKGKYDKNYLDLNFVLDKGKYDKGK